MAKKMKRDQLTAIGLISAIAKNFVAQRARVSSMQKASSEVPDPAERRAQKEQEKKRRKAEKKARRTEPERTPEELRATIDSRRAELVQTVEQVKYDLDVPARARDLRDSVAKELPSGWRGPKQAVAAASAVVVSGLGIIAAAVASRVRSRG